MMDWMSSEEIMFYVVYDRDLHYAIHATRDAFIFKDDQWTEVNYVTQIMDRIMGYDGSEAPGFQLYNRDIMEEIKEISKEEVIKRFGKKPIKLLPKKV